MCTVLVIVYRLSNLATNCVCFWESRKDLNIVVYGVRSLSSLQTSLSRVRAPSNQKYLYLLLGNNNCNKHINCRSACLWYKGPSMYFLWSTILSTTAVVVSSNAILVLPYKNQFQTFSHKYRSVHRGVNATWVLLILNNEVDTTIWHSPFQLYYNY